jgi:hypothetical protein
MWEFILIELLTYYYLPSISIIFIQISIYEYIYIFNKYLFAIKRNSDKLTIQLKGTATFLPTYYNFKIK